MQTSNTNSAFANRLEVSMHYNIRAERVRIGETVEQVAEAVGVTPSSVTKWERNEVEPSGRNLVKLTDHFGCSADWLLDMSEDRNIHNK